MSADVTFIHLTDLHIGHPHQPDAHLLTDTTETLETILQQVEAIRPRPAFIVASGDLTNTGDVESFRRLKRAFETTEIPILMALGNHDTRPGFYEGMLGRDDLKDEPYFYDGVVGDVHVIVLDSSMPGRVGGTIEPEQFAWLAQVLDTHPELRKLIVSHHPPALGTEPDATPWRTIDFAQSQQLAELLKGRDILGILSGHIHHDRVSIWHGIPVIVGTGQHAGTDILHTEALRMVRSASFGLCTVRASGLTVAFIPMPSDRAELRLVPYASIRQLDHTTAAVN